MVKETFDKPQLNSLVAANRSENVVCKHVGDYFRRISISRSKNAASLLFD